MDAATLNGTLSGLVESVGQSVVRVEGRHHGAGSGVVWSADGHVVTAAHNLEREDHLSVGLPDNVTVPAEFVGEDPTSDLAVLKVAAKDLQPTPWGQLDGVKVGHLALTLARPGRTVRATLGIVGALGEEWRTPSGGRVERYVETDSPPQAGFSGGPVVDVTGKVLGLHTSGLLRSTTIVIPAQTIARVVGELLSHGRVRRGYLGVGAYPVALKGDLEQLSGTSSGLLVVSVQTDSPADKAGILLGDTLTSLDGQNLESMGDLLGMLNKVGIGQSVKVKVIRAAKLMELTLTIGQRP